LLYYTKTQGKQNRAVYEIDELWFKSGKGQNILSPLQNFQMDWVPPSLKSSASQASSLA